MIKKSTIIVSSIGALMLVAAAILGITYVLTGNEVDSKFVGHIINSDGKINDSEMSEGMAYFAGIIALFGVCATVAPIGLSQRKLSKVEKNERKKEISALVIGMAIVVITSMTLMTLAPKKSWTVNQFKSTGIYYGIMAVLLVGAITSIVGMVRLIKAGKKPIVSEPKPSDEF